MAYSSGEFPGFGAGLNLRDKEDAVKPDEAIDLLNVVFTDRGAVEQRPGYAVFTDSSLTNDVASLHPHYESDGTRQLLAGCGTRLEALNTSGEIVASATGLNTGIWSFVRFGGPSAEVTYAANGANAVRKWDGSSWSTATAIGQPRYLAVMAVERGNRMVIGGFSAGNNGPGSATVSPSTVHFSDPGAPETYSNNAVDFAPGDGERIQGIIAWREFVFIFKETKFFVINGSSEGPDGSPIFHWYAVDTGVGLASPRALTAGPEGVYFMSRNGVYRTTGGEPELVSDLIEPIWLGGASDYYTGGIISHAAITNCTLHWHEERLYLGFPTDSVNDRTLVFDPRYNWWSLWDLPAADFTTFRITNRDELVFGAEDEVMVFGSATNDAGDAIASYWRSGWFDYGTPDMKTIRESKIWGIGSVFMGISTDFSRGIGDLNFLNMDSGTGVTWGGGAKWGDGSKWGAPAGRQPLLSRYAARGTVFSTYFQNDILDNHWSIARLDHHIREQRVPSVVRDD